MALGVLGAAAAVLLAGGAQAFSAATVYRESAPSVVVIFGFDAKGRGGSGTGTIVSAQGLVLTNDHVVVDARTRRPYRTLQVFLKPARVTGDDRRDLRSPLKVRVVARDEALDLALLQIVDPPPGLEAIDIGDSEEVEVGEPVAAIGHPGGGGLWTLTTGTVSSVRRDGVRDVFQTDTAINPGNSGGPLLDENARLIGVNTFVRRVNKQGLPLEGLNYSLRSAMALEWLGHHAAGLAAVRRADSAREPVPAPVPQPRAEPSPPGGDPRPGAPDAPSPESRASASSEPAAPPVPADEPGEGREAEPREFEGENGEWMFGVPNRNFRLDRARKDVYKRTLEKAKGAFDELDGSFDDEMDSDL